MFDFLMAENRPYLIIPNIYGQTAGAFPNGSIIETPTTTLILSEDYYIPSKKFAKVNYQGSSKIGAALGISEMAIIAAAIIIMLILIRRR
jgi:hypothetical protein